MNVSGGSERTLIETPDGLAVSVIDQTQLPARFTRVRLESHADVAAAISDMTVRGAPLIGVAAAYGLAFALRDDPSDRHLSEAFDTLLATRPTAVNLRWALEETRRAVEALPPKTRFEHAWEKARSIATNEVAACRAIAGHASALLQSLRDGPGRKDLNIMTHCNAGWLATIDWGTALAPVYLMHDAGIPVHVWVSETRPRNQGLLTAWELAAHGVPFTLAVDNSAGLLLAGGKVDACIVGADRISRKGDVCNKIGTYLKALAARDADVPFFVAAPSSSIDWAWIDRNDIAIEERSASEVSAGAELPVTNPGFDVTPARLVSALITERGVCAATEPALTALFPDKVAGHPHVASPR